MTPSGIEPATFRFVAQHLNHRVTYTVCIKMIYNIFVLPVSVNIYTMVQVELNNVQGESLARGPKLLSIKNYVIEIMI